MKKIVSKGAKTVSQAAKARPAETRWSIIGAAVGVVIGLLVGGVGIAALGGATGVPAALILGVMGAFFGNRYGISRDRPLP
ncbi:hypothetical protein [Rhizobium leguminosarum]|uniref:hypothetical protein n=1 Tax=Rhizobium leguminosarum TaxID=384 RepID=UPI001440F38A|nr:hypothetical protein [Rhizobium leguminosarum]NKJ77743.1 hypothetical protein [Rhizobium leguminosarum bv. viciae]